MEDAKIVAEKPVKKVKKIESKPKAVKKPARRRKVIREVNLSRGFLLTGLLGLVFYGLLINGNLDFLPETWEVILNNEVELFQTSAGLFLIGLFSYNEK